MQAGNEPKILTLENSYALVGVSLSSDMTSEHEWGIEGIRSRFGIDKTLPGLRSRKITKTPSDFKWVDWDDGTCGFGTFSSYEAPSTAKVPYGLDYFRGGLNQPKNVGRIAGAWDERSFGVRVTADLREPLLALFKSFQTGDICIMLGGGSAIFENHGLLICRYSDLPPEIDTKIRASQKDAQEIKEYEENSGIKERLLKAGCKFGYLGARRKPNGTMGWWLNNGENPNRTYHEDLYGWFTLEELEQWARGEGRLAAFPKSDEKRNKSRRSR